MAKILLLLCLVWAAPALASPLDGIAPERIREVAASRYWHLLMRYKPGFFGGVHSEVDGKDFFLAKNGADDPEAELRATVEVFTQSIQIGKLKLHPQCAFPERFRFLRQELKFKIEPVSCPKFQEFLGRFRAESATLVFSSAYPNNPGSMFGHTFLRINAREESGKKKHDILDHGLSYAAMVADDENPFAFVALGLSGGYMGQFTLLPYFQKVNEYSNAESRDLWEYDLNLNAEETTRMLGNVWEIETNSYFHYFFFDENCAYHLLRLLEVAKPEWGDLGHYWVHLIPGESVKRVVDVAGAVRGVKFRPSLYKRLLQHLNGLSSAEREDFFAVTEKGRAVDGKLSPAVLEGVNTYVYYQKQKQKGTLTPEQEKLLADSTRERAKRVGAPPLMLAPIPEETRPDLGHHANRLGTTGGFDFRGGTRRYFQELHFRFAYHDLLNRDLGFSRFSHIEFPNLALRYDTKDKKLSLRRVEALAITSLFPWNFLEHPLSWKLALRYETPQDLCLRCHVAHAEMGAGLAANFFSDRHVAYSLVMLDGDFGPSAPKGYRVGFKFHNALLLTLGSRWKSQLRLDPIVDLGGGERERWRLQYAWENGFSLGQEWDLRASIERHQRTRRTRPNVSIATMGVNYYF